MYGFWKEGAQYAGRGGTENEPAANHALTYVAMVDALEKLTQPYPQYGDVISHNSSKRRC